MGLKVFGYSIWFIVMFWQGFVRELDGSVGMFVWLRCMGYWFLVYRFDGVGLVVVVCGWFGGGLGFGQVFGQCVGQLCGKIVD